MKLGLIILLVGMLTSLFFCVRRWDHGPIYKYLPPVYGLAAGIVLAVAAAGWIFWFAVWVERRASRDKEESKE